MIWFSFGISESTYALNKPSKKKTKPPCTYSKSVLGDVLWVDGSRHVILVNEGRLRYWKKVSVCLSLPRFLSPSTLKSSSCPRGILCLAHLSSISFSPSVVMKGEDIWAWDGLILCICVYVKERERERKICLREETTQHLIWSLYLLCIDCFVEKQIIHWHFTCTL